MKEYKREYPQFALCGLNCGLCPRHQTDGGSRCPGCGGKDFHLIHPTCSVITCNQKHDNVEFCFQCSAYPCDRYSRIGETDSFITYRNVLSDLEKAKQGGVNQYIAVLDEKIGILEFLIQNYNDGKSKNYYCIAVNLLDLVALKEIMKAIREEIDIAEAPLNVKIGKIRTLLEAHAAKAGLKLKLRK